MKKSGRIKKIRMKWSMSLEKAKTILEEYGFLLQRENLERRHLMMVRRTKEGRLHASLNQRGGRFVGITIHYDKTLFGIHRVESIPQKDWEELEKDLKILYKKAKI